MLEKLSNKLTSFLITNNSIDTSEKDCYIYFFQKFFGVTIYVLVTMLFSLIINKPIETAIFLIFFLYMRKQTGGYHTNHSSTCLIMSILFSLVSVSIVPYFSAISLYLQIIVYAISCTVLFIFAPINHPNFNGTKEEMDAKKKKMYVIIILYSILISILCCFDYLCTISATIILSMSLTAILVLLAKILKQEVLLNERI